MSLSSERLANAELRAEQARENVLATVQALRNRVAPSRLATEAKNELQSTGCAIARRGQRVARDRPQTVAIAVGLVTLFLARHRIAGLFRRGSKFDRQS